MDALMPLFSMLGDHGLIWILIAAGLLIPASTRKIGLITLTALILGVVLGELLIKNIVCRLRPFMIFDFLDTVIKTPASYSFPSGHTTASFAAASCLAGLGKKQAAAAFVLAGLIAFSRIYLNVHYLTDVAGGILLGLLCAFVAKLLFKKCKTV